MEMLEIAYIWEPDPGDRGKPVRATGNVPHRQNDEDRGLRYVEDLVLTRCAGYATKPEGKDVIAGIRHGGCNWSEQRAVMCFLAEATPAELVLAGRLGAYELRDLLNAARWAGLLEADPERIETVLTLWAEQT